VQKHAEPFLIERRAALSAIRADRAAEKDRFNRLKTCNRYKVKSAKEEEFRRASQRPRLKRLSKPVGKGTMK
jgi:hypothetical protein